MPCEKLKLLFLRTYKYINVLCGQPAEFLNIRVAVKSSVYRPGQVLMLSEISGSQISRK
jgi:hypothetical protein